MYKGFHEGQGICWPPASILTLFKKLAKNLEVTEKVRIFADDNMKIALAYKIFLDYLDNYQKNIIFAAQMMSNLKSSKL